jgi:hypothetical protein
MFSHILSFVRRQTNKVNTPIITKYCQEIKDHFENDFTHMPLEHWQRASMQIGDGMMFFHVHTNMQVKI